MAKIAFRRILHPVGHGAFFTEQFWDERKNRYFNVVYDCGGIRNKTILEEEINSSFEENEHIDMLFISHFDDDHVNGLATLANNGRRIDKDTKVYVPFSYPYLVVAMDEDYPEMSKFVTLAARYNAQFIGIEESTDLDSEYRGFERFQGEYPNRSIVMREWQTIPIIIEGNGIPVWYYSPFMQDDEKCKEDRKTFIESIEDSFGEIDLHSYKDIQDNLVKLRKIYQRLNGKGDDVIVRDDEEKGISPRKTLGVTRININSLMLLSFPAHDVVRYVSCWQAYCNIPYLVFNKILKMEEENLAINPSCLYTGDTKLSRGYYDSVLNAAIPILYNHSDIDVIGMMQVPHHGSRHCYTDSIATDKRVQTSFINFAPDTSRKPHLNNIYSDFHAENKRLFLVTKDYQSRVTLEIKQLL